MLNGLLPAADHDAAFGLLLAAAGSQQRHIQKDPEGQA
jgi:hypothetical protein